MWICSKSTATKGWILHSLVVAVAVALGARSYLSRSRSRVVGVIPARFASTRFQGKPLVPILGKPMIQRTWERAKLAATLDEVVVATDDEKIAECCRGFGAEVIMTSESCRNGTERCNEALQNLGKKYDIVVNIQGDEPLIEPEIIDGIVKALQGEYLILSRTVESYLTMKLDMQPYQTALRDAEFIFYAAPDAVFSTAVTSLKPEDAFDPNRVKCVVDNHGSGKINPQFPYLLHLGIQSYDSKFLKIYPKLAPTPLQLEEDIEQLKVLKNGYKMKVIKVNHETHGVDTPEDVEKIQRFMREKNLS